MNLSQIIQKTIYSKINQSQWNFRRPTFTMDYLTSWKTCNKRTKRGKLCSLVLLGGHLSSLERDFLSIQNSACEKARRDSWDPLVFVLHSNPQGDHPNIKLIFKHFSFLFSGLHLGAQFLWSGRLDHWTHYYQSGLLLWSSYLKIKALINPLLFKI